MANGDASNNERPFAVLIDADNANPNIVDGLLSEVAKLGIASVKRIYGDWTTPNLGGWKALLLEHSIQPIQQFRYTVGKNATASAMIIDAMDLLYTGPFGGFCIVSSDSDFTRLASRLREAGKVVYYHGQSREAQGKENTPTFYMHRDLTKPYHIDYAFAPRNMRGQARLGIGDPRDWLDCSDHMPLVIDLECAQHFKFG